MSIYKQKVKEIANEVYSFGFNQIVIDIIQENIEELLEKDDLCRDDIGAAKYDCSVLLEVFNPVFEKDISLLTRLEKALSDWCDDYESVNKILGLPPEN